MLVTVICSVALALGLTYFFLIQWVLQKWAALPSFVPPPLSATPKATILVAARNEEGNISRCLQALSQQEYPKDSYWIIVIDDHSTDETAAVVEQWSLPNLTLLQLPEGLLGKKAALEFGAATAQSEIILTTDADCQPPPQWVHSHVQHILSRQLEAAAGPVLLTGTDCALYRFQALDMAGMMILTAVGLHTRSWTLGNGASLAYRRIAFEQAGGYAGNRNTASGDDIFLIAKLSARSPGQVQFLKDAVAAVPTPAAANWRAFVRQRLRWGTKNAAAPTSIGTTLALGVAFLLSWSILLLPFLVFWNAPWALLTFALLLHLKAWADYRLLRTASRYFGQSYLLRTFAVSEVLHVLYIAFIGVAALVVRKYKWKGRTVQ